MRRLLVPLAALSLFGLALGCGHDRGDVCNCSCTSAPASNCCAPASNGCAPGLAPAPGVLLPGQPLPGGGAGKNGSGKVPDMPPADKTTTPPQGKDNPEPSLKKDVEPTAPF